MQTPTQTPSTPTTTTPTTVNINSTPTTPPAPMPEEIPTKKPNTLMVVLLTFLITALLFVGGYYAYKIYYPNPNNTYVLGPSSNPYPSGSAMPYASSSASPSADSGKVEGKICYPSEGIPAGKVVAKNISTNELTSFDYAANTSALSVSLPAGTYYLRYEPNAANSLIGYYTNCTGVEASCQDKQTKRASIPVVVEAGKTSSGVSICDYYYEEGMEPTF